jgi:hypothetical protein
VKSSSCGKQVVKARESHGRNPSVSHARSDLMIAAFIHLILFMVFLLSCFLGFAIFMITFFAKRNPAAAIYWANTLRRILRC